MNRLLRFALGGCGGFVVQVAMPAVLTQWLGVHYLVATMVSVEAAILLNFMWHESWTWRERVVSSSSDRWQRLARYNALTAVTSIAGTAFIVFILVEGFSLPPVIANLISIAALSAVNFVGANALVFRSLAAVAMLTLALPAHASGEALLQAKTARDFAKYVAAVEARRAQDIANHEPFLDVERQPPSQLARTMAALKRGEVIVSRGAARDASSNEIVIDGGLINHWRGTVFVPNVSVDQLLKVLQEPQSDKHKQEDVLSSRVISRDEHTQKVFLRLRRTKFVTVVYDTEYDVEYRRLPPDRAFSNSISTKVVEIENAGTPNERALPEGDDHGYMWRLNSYWRYKQVDGGVLVEIESLTLSRSLPAIIGPLIRPIVNSTARESMSRTLASVRARFAS
ncbi:MAG: GtrA family protein [Vicinamibacterales bacterium]